MRPRHVFCVAAAVLAAVCASVIPATRQAAAAKPPLAASAADLTVRHALRIVAFGSSSTQGIGASAPAFAYPARLQADLRAALPTASVVSVVNRGIGGEDAEDMMRRLPQVLADHPDLVIWQTGTNDPLRGLPLARFLSLTRQGVAMMRAAGLDVMLMEPQDCPVFSGRSGALGYRDAVRAVGAEFGIPVIRRYDLMDRWLASAAVTRAQLQAPDGLHMSDAGYRLLAKSVADAILSGIMPPAPAAVLATKS